MKPTVFLTKDGVFEAYNLNQKKGTIAGYKLFPAHGEGNPYRTFNIIDVQIKELNSYADLYYKATY